MKKFFFIIILLSSYTINAEVDEFDICKTPESKCLAVKTESQLEGNIDGVRSDCDEVSFTSKVEKVVMVAYYQCRIHFKGAKHPLVIRIKEAKPWKKYQDFKPAEKPTM